MAARITQDEMVSRSDANAILRCRSCKAVGRISFTIVTTTRAYMDQPVVTQDVEIDGRTRSIRDRHDLERIAADRQCPACGGWSVEARTVKGVYVANKRCDARCESATGVRCECSCSGQNHGASHQTWG